MNLADGFHNYFVDGGATGINHDGLVTDARPLSLITALIDDGNVAGHDLPWGISSVLADCFSGWHAASSTDDSSGSDGSGATIEFSAHGTVTLEISDPTGLHTGITYNGSVELGIPGSSYDAIGDNTFVTVPKNENSIMNASTSINTGNTGTSTSTGPAASTTTYIVKVTERKTTAATESATSTVTGVVTSIRRHKHRQNDQDRHRENKRAHGDHHHEDRDVRFRAAPERKFLRGAHLLRL